MNIISKRKIWYAISALMIVPGMISLAVHGLKLGIDFTGGSLIETQGQLSEDQATKAAAGIKLENITITPSGEDRTLLRYRDPEEDPTKREANHQTLKQRLAQAGHQELRFDTVGPSVSKDITRN